MTGRWFDFVLICILTRASRAMFSIKKEHLNMVLIGYDIDQFDTNSHHRCIRACQADYRCKSTNFCRKHGTCDLNRANSSEVSSTDFICVPGCVFSDNSEWPLVGYSCNDSPCASEACFPKGPDYACKSPGNCEQIRFEWGSANDTSTSLGTYLQVTCDDGSQLSGSDVIQCMSNGLWSDYPVCIPAISAGTTPLDFGGLLDQGELQCTTDQSVCFMQYINKTMMVNYVQATQFYETFDICVSLCYDYMQSYGGLKVIITDTTDSQNGCKCMTVTVSEYLSENSGLVSYDGFVLYDPM